MKRKIIFTSLLVLFLVLFSAFLSCDDGSDTTYQEGGTIVVRNISPVERYNVKITGRSSERQIAPNGRTTFSLSDNGTYQIEYRRTSATSSSPWSITSAYVSNGRTVEVQIP